MTKEEIKNEAREKLSKLARVAIERVLTKKEERELSELIKAAFPGSTNFFVRNYIADLEQSRKNELAKFRAYSRAFKRERM